MLDTCGLASLRLWLGSDVVVGELPILRSLTHLGLFNDVIVSFDEPLLQHADKLQEFDCGDGDINSPNFLRWLVRLQPKSIRVLRVDLASLSTEDEQTLQQFDLDQLHLDNINSIHINFSNDDRDYMPFLQRFLPRVSRASMISLDSYFNKHQPTANQFPLLVDSLLSGHFHSPPDTVQTVESTNVFDAYFHSVTSSIEDAIGYDVDDDDDGCWVYDDVHLIKNAIGRQLGAVLQKWEARVEKVERHYSKLTLVVKSAQSPHKQLTIELWCM